MAPAGGLGLLPAAEGAGDGGACGAVDLDLDGELAAGAGAPAAVDGGDAATLKLHLGEDAVFGVGTVGGAAFVDAAGDEAAAGGGDGGDGPGEDVDHVAPVGKHIEDEAAAVTLAVVPAGPLARVGEAVVDPAAHLDADFQDVAEEALLAEAQEGGEAGEEELVLDGSGAQAGRGCQAVQVQGRGDGGGDGFLQIDVLAGGDGLVRRGEALAGGGGVEEQRVVACEGGGEVGAGAGEAGAGGGGGEFGRVAADEEGVGQEAAAILERQAALVADGGEGGEVLFGGELAGGAVEDDADGDGGIVRQGLHPKRGWPGGGRAGGGCGRGRRRPWRTSRHRRPWRGRGWGRARARA